MTFCLIQKRSMKYHYFLDPCKTEFRRQKYRNIPVSSSRLLLSEMRRRRKYPFFRSRIMGTQFAETQFNVEKEYTTICKLEIKYTLPMAPIFHKIRDALRLAAPGINVQGCGVSGSNHIFNVIREADGVQLYTHNDQYKFEGLSCLNIILQRMNGNMVIRPTS
eukprot:GHVL01018469.1.p1 GENE.GHVL01018469.1~~GHVL01018469.1.p1  ORF type:complete len:163 (-),score=20.59 GHVL01018469.1:454-942(-)